jgi:hypothetical protein
VTTLHDFDPALIADLRARANRVLCDDEIIWHALAARARRDGPDNLGRVTDDLMLLPALPEWQMHPYLLGGWQKYASEPPRTEVARQLVGHDPNGKPVYRRKVRDLEKMPDGTRLRVGESSREQTLSSIRAMRSSGWTREDAKRMMNRSPAKGTRWLLKQRDPEAEFERSWEKAEVPVSRLPQRQRQSSLQFVSLMPDRMAVLAYIEAHPGLGVRELQRAGAGITGAKPKGRIEAALAELRKDGLVRTEPGPRRALFHYVTGESY